MNAEDSELERIEQLLAEAGFGFTVVATCPDAACEFCRGDGMPAAA